MRPFLVERDILDVDCNALMRDPHVGYMLSCKILDLRVFLMAFRLRSDN